MKGQRPLHISKNKKLPSSKPELVFVFLKSSECILTEKGKKLFKFVKAEKSLFGF